MNENSITSNLTIKILALVFAIFLWYYVITEQNPVITKEFSIPIKLINLEYIDKNNMVLLEDPSSFVVTIKVKGNSNVLDKVNENTVLATADVSGHKAKGENYVRVDISDLPEGVSILRKSIENIKITLDPRISVQSPVAVNVTGNPSQGLAAMTPQPNPTDVLITGAETQVNKVKTVRIDVDIAGVNSDVKKVLPVRLFDAEGKEVTGIQVDPKNVEVSVPIAGAVRLPIRLDMVGTAPDGYTVSEPSIFPREILVTGKPEALNGITYIKTEKIDITGISQDIDREVKLEMPPGVELVNKNETLKVFIDIEKTVTKQIVIDNIELRNLDPSLVLDGNPGNLQLTVRGPESVINEAPANMKFYVDLRHGVEGSNMVNVMWEKPEEIEIVDMSTQQLTIMLKKAQ